MYTPTDGQIAAARAVLTAETKYLLEARTVEYDNRGMPPHLRDFEHGNVKKAQADLEDARGYLYTVCDWRPEQVAAATKAALHEELEP